MQFEKALADYSQSLVPVELGLLQYNLDPLDPSIDVIVDKNK